MDFELSRLVRRSQLRFLMLAVAGIVPIDPSTAVLEQLAVRDMRNLSDHVRIRLLPICFIRSNQGDFADRCTADSAPEASGVRPYKGAPCPLDQAFLGHQRGFPPKIRS